MEGKNYEEEEQEGFFDEETEAKARAVVAASQCLWSRVIRPPQKRRGHVIIETCEPNGELEKRIVAKSHGTVFGIGKEGYRRARKTRLGDLWSYADVKKKTNSDDSIAGNAIFDEEAFIREWLRNREDF